MPSDAVRRLAAEPVDHRFKGLPPDAEAAGLTVGELAAQARDLYSGGFTTPVLTLDADALAHNLTVLGAYAARHHLAFAPHGKTCMAPQLFERQLDHGAWGITAAVPHQARVYRAFGIQRIFLANELVDPAALRWVAAELAADPGFRFVCYVDSVRGVQLMDRALQGQGARVDVVVELGAGEGARTGARSDEDCRAVADAVAATATLRLVGIAGYEAEVPDADPEKVHAWLRRLTGLAVEFDKAGRFGDTVEEIVVSAGGSAWFDAVADVFGELPELSRPVLKLLRSGAYVSHDHGWYTRLTPFNRVPEEGGLRPAFRLWTQVVSRPSPTQAFVNAGKRDIAYDLGLPEAELVRDASTGEERAATGVRVVKLSDQHAWLETDSAEDVQVGDWVALGMSHPCTIFEKWPLIPVVSADGAVREYVRTFF
ncbi:D-serine deaminase-like pyridoxal phosphate-dependent protein [Streptomyces sp. 3211.6]|uniref:alanine racemase n=1 Tax=Streptomyces TaxID=1883 RepID=UPI0009A50F62|nr:MULTISPECIES: alanine racemase [Streptomyces]RKT06591.1 D-serine deaminase-like pyridoxal phosphate-dependent protein [Streptomyces sp. 3211.6]RPF45872.1 D-serine deaminase-like pyridoxal phosphate-dependent protein [Streptomyces sp. Ag109_G2-6]